MKRHESLIPLSREHTTALMLALQIQRELPAAGPDEIARHYNRLLSFWARGLLPHFRAESECLLARLVRHVEPNSELVTRVQEDHLGMAALVADMQDNHDIEARRQMLLGFAERLQTHVRWEEKTLFQVTQERLTDGELAALGDDITERVSDGTTRLEG